MCLHVADMPTDLFKPNVLKLKKVLQPVFKYMFLLLLSLKLRLPIVGTDTNWSSQDIIQYMIHDV